MISELRNPLCTLCSLHENVKTICVMGNGDTDKKIMIVGEGPGATEDELGQPFVGKAGQVLNNVLNDVGIEREDVYITNIVKCRTPGNRRPEPNEIDACVSHYLVPEYKYIKPKVVLLLGNTALHTLTSLKGGISQHRGYVPSHASSMIYSDVYATYHPSATMYSASVKFLFEKDFAVFAKIVESLYTPSIRDDV